MKPRRSLTAVVQNARGPIESDGEAELQDILRDAFAACDEVDADSLTHGFHTYPARMHPGMARVLVERCAPADGLVLDPFCGSGTVVVEAMRAGRHAIGADLNPLALRIAEVHCLRPTEQALAAWNEEVNALCERSLERVRNRDDIRAPLSAPMARLYEGHTLRELAGLHLEIANVEDDDMRLGLEVVFSSLVIKLSRKKADTSDEQEVKRIRKGLPTEMFARKADELAARWSALTSEVPHGAHEPDFVLTDIRTLPNALGRETRCDAVITSPPYGGTYDYHQQHVLRMAWLGLADKDLERYEIGARRRMTKVDNAIAQWEHELLGALQSIGGVLKATGNAVLLLGDAQLQHQRIDAREQVGRLCQRWGLSLRASAAQERADWQGGRPRLEHLLWLSPHGAKKRVQPAT